MTCNVFSGTLNLNQSIIQSGTWYTPALDWYLLTHLTQWFIYRHLQHPICSCLNTKKRVAVIFPPLIINTADNLRSIDLFSYMIADAGYLWGILFVRKSLAGSAVEWIRCWLDLCPLARAKLHSLVTEADVWTTCPKSCLEIGTVHTRVYTLSYMVIASKSEWGCDPIERK